MKNALIRCLRIMTIVTLCAAIALPVSAADVRQQSVFVDVPPDRYGWAMDAIHAMARQQVLTGYPDGTFLPEQTVSKAEWTAMVHRLFNKYRPNLYASGVQKVTGFADVPELHWAYGPISDIYNASFSIGGYGLDRNGELAFRPEMQMNRMQLAIMLYSFFDNRLIDRGLSEKDVCAVVSSLKDVPVKYFSDSFSYDAFVQSDGRYESGTLMSMETNDLYAIAAMGQDGTNCTLGTDPLANVMAKSLASLQTAGIMTPNEAGYFRPLDRVTRAEAVTILHRIYNYLKRKQWLYDYTSIDLEAGYQIGGAGLGAVNKPSDGSGGGFKNNPGSSLAGPGASLPGPGADDWGYNGDASLGLEPIGPNVTIQDYFDENGVIEKDLQTGEIQAGVEIRGEKYLTIDLKADEKVNLYVILDGQIAYVTQRELPMTIPVSSVSLVGFRTQWMERDAYKKGEMKATLSVKLTNTPPAKGKKK